MTSQPEQVVLVNESGSPVGACAKSEVHGVDTPLHLAFSCYIFDSEGRLLVTRRALMKQTWPGVWTNSFCGHPAPGEELESAIVRRAAEELGARIEQVKCQLPSFRYHAVDASGTAENEICPVFTARLAGSLSPNPHEAAEWEWIKPAELLAAVMAAPFVFSPWMQEQLPLLHSIGALTPEASYE